ncbi:MAG: hypothetical protein V4561_03830 [Bacteroidota bacterium]
MRFKYQFQTGALLSMSLFFFACSHQKVCRNANPVLNEKDYNTVIYKKAIREALETIPKNSVSYYLNHYFIKDGNEYLVADIKSKNLLCAKAEFLVNPGVFLSDIRKTNGMGYSGAKLNGLQFESKQKADTIILIINKIESIID